MGQNAVYVGQIPGDDTGDPAPIAFTKINGDIAALYAALAGAGIVVNLGYATTTLSVASTNNLNLGGGFPAGIYQIDFTCTVQATLTGMQAGLFNGQPMWLSNTVASSNNLLLPIENTGSSAANRWRGVTGTLALIPGGRTLAVYYTGPGRWSIG